VGRAAFLSQNYKLEVRKRQRSFIEMELLQVGPKGCVQQGPEIEARSH
jgi:hypothetical protein